MELQSVSPLLLKLGEEIVLWPYGLKQAATENQREQSLITLLRTVAVVKRQTFREHIEQ